MKRKRSLLHDVGFGTTNSNSPALSLLLPIPSSSHSSPNNNVHPSPAPVSSSSTTPSSTYLPPAVPLTITSRSSSPSIATVRTSTSNSNSKNNTIVQNTDDLFWQNLDELPNDTELVLHRFHTQFSTIVASKVRQKTDLLNEKVPRFEILCGIPIIPLTVVYGSIYSSLSIQYRTRIDKDIAELQKNHTIRLLKLLTDDSKEFAVGYTMDIKNYVLTKQEFYRKSLNSGGTSTHNNNNSSSSSIKRRSSSSSSNSMDQNKSKNISDTYPTALSSSSSLMVDNCTTTTVPELPQDTDTVTALDVYCYLSNMYPVAVLLSHDEIVQCYQQWISEGKPHTELKTNKVDTRFTGPSGSSSSTSSPIDVPSTRANTTSVPTNSVSTTITNSLTLTSKLSSSLSTTSSTTTTHPPVASIFRILLSLGLLVRRNDTHISTLLASQSFAPGASVAYYFGIPESGRIITYLRNGRIELCQRIKRTNYKEIKRQDVLKMNLTRSALPMELHIRDAIGLGILTELSTANGKFIALPSSSLST